MRTAFIARSAFSPDGHWLAYQQSTGTFTRNRLWVQPYPGTGAKYPIVDGGQPFWSPDGNELFYNSGAGGLISKVKITARPTFNFGDVMPVAQGQFVNMSSARFPRNADIRRDGKLLGFIPAETTQSGSLIAPQIQVVLNWFEELKRRAPVK